MHFPTTFSKAVWTSVALLCLYPARASSSNGLNLIGFGTESVAMGGADLAVARDTTAMNTNPAGLSQIPGDEFDLFGAYSYPVSVRHGDMFGNDVEVSNRSIILGSGGIAHRWGNGPLTLGIGVFAQGGAGAVYKNLSTPFGTRDELSSLFRIAKATPSAAYKVNDSLFLGASIQVVYSDIRQKVFPETSVSNAGNPELSFFGSEVKEMNGIGVGAKIGVIYKFFDRVTLGAAYTTRVNLPLKDGKVIASMSADGLGKVTYRNARIEGLALPQEAGVGISMRPTLPLLIALEVNWVNWSSTMKTSTLRASDPDNAGAPPILSNTTTLDWRDQYVFALGVAYDVTERTVIRAGYNYGKNPIPANTLNPLLAAINERHATFGLGYAFRGNWRTDGALEYAFNKKITYANHELPFGPGAREENEYIAVHLMVARRW